LTAAGFFFFNGSSLIDFFPSELTEPVSGGTTSYYNNAPTPQKKRAGKKENRW
jgi:hypothetical protein